MFGHADTGDSRGYNGGMERPHVEKPDIAEHGAGGASSEARLYMQLLVYSGCIDTAPLIDVLGGLDSDVVLYEDMNDPTGVAVLTMHRDPAWFIDTLRCVLAREPFEDLLPRPEMTMVGRSYALGYEADLEETLFTRPKRTATNADWPWAIWYPLRRKGSFMQLPADEQRAILMEHGKIGMAFGQADLAHDVRLACHGLDANDNDFVIGIIGAQLTPLSKVVETMRRTVQTSQYIEKLGPFFVGRAVWRKTV